MSTERPGQNESIDSDQNTKGITLLDDEIVLKNVRPSWINWWGILLVGILIALLGVAVLLGGDVVFAVLLFVVAGVFIGYVRLARSRSRIIVTNQRVKKSVGLARRSTGETRITKIRGLTTEQGLIERSIGKGSVLIDSGAAGGKLGIKGVDNHDGLANTIREQQRRIEENR
jgi:uncharacterized membrane protein YdbT with pleckstrin-like domain